MKSPKDTAINDLQFVLAGWYNYEEGERDQDISYDCSIDVEYPVASGTLYPVQWSSGATVTVAPGETVTSNALALPANIPADTDYTLRIWMKFAFTVPVATLTISGGQFASTNITVAGSGLNGAHATALTGSVSGVGAGSGGAMTCNVTGGQLTSISLTPGSGYTDGTYSITFGNGVFLGEFYRLDDKRTGEASQWGNNIANSQGSAVDPSPSILPSFLPVGVLARQITSAPAVAVLGDSIATGAADTIDSSGQSGFIQRVLHKGHGVMDITRGFYSAFRYNASHSLEDVMLANCTHLLCQFGTNDFFVLNRSAAQLQSDLQTLWAPFIEVGISVYQTTITPYTTSSDDWATTANQTTNAQSAKIATVNAWLRTNWQSLGLAGVIDVASVVEDGGAAAPTGKWKADGSTADLWTADGLHPSAYAHDAVIAAGHFQPIPTGIGRRFTATW